MRKLSIWDDVHFEIAELQKQFDSKLAKAVEAVALTIYCDPSLTKREIRTESGIRKQTVSRILKKLLQIGWLKTEGRGIKGDAFKYYSNEQDKN